MAFFLKLHRIVSETESREVLVAMDVESMEIIPARRDYKTSDPVGDLPVRDEATTYLVMKSGHGYHVEESLSDIMKAIIEFSRSAARYAAGNIIPRNIQVEV